MKRIFIAVLAAMSFVNGAQAQGVKRFIIPKEVGEECMIEDGFISKEKHGIIFFREDDVFKAINNIAGMQFKYLILIGGIENDRIFYQVFFPYKRYGTEFGQKVCEGEAPLEEFLPKK